MQKVYLITVVYVNLVWLDKTKFSFGMKKKKKLFARFNFTFKSIFVK